MVATLVATLGLLAPVSAWREIQTGAQSAYVFYWSATTHDLMIDWLG